jgi:hypothetical protein
VPPRDPAWLVELDDGVEDLVRHHEAHVHTEASAEAEPFRATGLDITNRARAVDDRVLGGISEDVEDALWVGGHDPFHRNDRGHAPVWR